MSQISLTASMRSNLLSLQGISGQVSLTQNRLSTGLKINSAIDNPANYYAANSLNNRAADLGALLDSMGQAVQTVKAANETIESAAKFLEQAASVAAKALETNKIPAKSWFESKVGSNGAVVSTAQELKDAIATNKSTIVVYGKLDYFENQSITLKTNQKLVGTEYFTGHSGQQKFSELNFKSNLERNAINLADKTLVSDLTINYDNSNTVGSGSPLYLAGNYSANVNNVDVKFKRSDTGGAGAVNAAIYAAGGAEININGSNRLEVSGYYVSGSLAINNARVNYLAGSTTDIIMPGQSSSDGYGLYTWMNSTTNIEKGATVNIKSEKRGGIGILSKSTVNIKGNVNMEFPSVAASMYTMPISMWGHVNYGGNELNVSSSTTLNIKTAQPTWLFNQFKGNYDANKISFANGVQINGMYNGVEKSFVSNGYAYANNTAIDQTLSFASLATMPEFAATSIPANIDWNKIIRDAPEKVDSKADEGQYSTILAQYDNLIKDSSYKGVNLLKGDNLNVKFDGQGESKLEVTGKNLSSATLGLTTKDWQTQGDIAKSLVEIASALKGIRSFSAELGNNYSIITTRQDFTENLINVLTEGADKLTLADMNEESANMLALQTRQQLAINSLSLASQAAQSVLKLF